MTKIEWTHAPGFKGETWNPATGCRKVSAGCKNCWAEGQFPRSYKRHGRVFTDVQFHPERLSQPLRWRKPRMIAVNLMGDLFHDDVTTKQIAAVFGVMAACPQHTFLVLTKRPEKMRQWFEWIVTRYTGAGFVSPAYFCRGKTFDYGIDLNPETSTWPIPKVWIPWPLPNVWLGVSVENQETADERIQVLRDTPASIRFVSCEPLLGPIDTSCPSVPHTGGPWPDWWIVGGESGNRARPMDPDWARNIRNQCKSAGVPFFFKQMAKKAPIPEDLMIREFPS